MNDKLTMEDIERMKRVASDQGIGRHVIMMSNKAKADLRKDIERRLNTNLDISEGIWF